MAGSRGRRGGRAATAASIACLVVGAGLVGSALAQQGEAPVEPPRTTSDVADAPYAAPGGDAPDGDDATSLPAPETAEPSPSSTRVTDATKGDVLPTEALAPEGDIPGLVRIPAPETPAPEPPAEPEAPEVAEPVRLRVPAIGVDTDLLHLGLNDDGSLAVPPREGPDNLKASWYDGSPRAGEVGPTVLAGHIDSKAGPSVFYRLGELEPGDEVLVDRADGTTATFVVDTSERYPKDDFPTRRVYGQTPDAQIRLITCGGVFDRSVGHYEDNTVVYGHLVDG
ncbi:class F sortase [uncultured Pseudokineococcus sp.]|uniref:class F sortase n=1 Tax=uncultured Pseudokineococcus sp. TaxID=1642928 RepID=UPI00262A2A00|nr:class F sortase [uncultured Pseudokineococcus sp.]